MQLLHRLILACAAITLAVSNPVAAQSPAEQQPAPHLKEWRFFPDYRLPQRAGLVPWVPSSTPIDIIPDLEIERPPLRLRGITPTHRMPLTLTPNGVSGALYAELWILDHVNQPVSATLAYRTDSPNVVSHDPPPIALTYDHRTASVQLAGKTVIQHNIGKGFKEYFYHVALTADHEEIRLFINGQQVATHPADLDALPPGMVELSSYLANEPHMQPADLVRSVAVGNQTLTPADILSRFDRHARLAESGLLCDQTLHFVAGPVLQGASTDRITILWETSQPTHAVLEWGRSAALGRRQNFDLASGPQHFTLDSLELDTPHFYRLTAKDKDGRTLDSGLLTFRTAIGKDQPLTFAVIADTESRPHINHAISKLIWDQRPHFVINAGDLSDGGQQPHKFQWTYEYFPGIGSLAARIPFFPVPGNGESDLHWYNAYHPAYGKDGFYNFTYGDAEFFMLDSNHRKNDFAPGGRQYLWLEDKLQKSNARWKFVVHHHPTYSSDEDDYGDTWKGPSTLSDTHVMQILPLYEKYNVDMVFFGHLHTYERSHPIRNGKLDPNGVIHVQAGGAGGHLEDFTPNRSWFTARSFRGHHYLTLTLTHDQLALRAFDVNGRMIDSLDRHKSIK